MNTQEIYRFLNRGLPIIGTGAIGTAPPPSAGNLGALWVDEFGKPWQYKLAGVAERNANLLTATSQVSKPMCFVKHRADYTEYSVYAPTDSTGTKFARWYFGNRLNTDNGGFPRLNGALYATLSGTLGVTDFTQVNTSAHIATGSAFLDILMGNGNVEQATYTRKTSIATADFVGGVHGKELLVSFDLYIDGVLTPYSSITVGQKIVCNNIVFVAKTQLGYPSDASTKWCELTYTGRISNGEYTCTVNSRVLIESEVRVDYVGFGMVAGSTNTQRYSTGFDLCTLGNLDLTLNQFNNTINPTTSFAESSFRNNGHLVVGVYKTKPQADSSPYITNPATVGTYVSRTDKFNKVYFQSKNENWDIYPVGYSQEYTNKFIIRNGDTTALDWVDKTPSVVLEPW